MIHLENDAEKALYLMNHATHSISIIWNKSFQDEKAESASVHCNDCDIDLIEFISS